jgi:hypothetical protein
MLSSDFPQLCPNCQGYKTMPYTWNSTFAPRMCNCPKITLAWECPRCNKINAPWKDSCGCTPMSSVPTCATQPHHTGGVLFNHYFKDPSTNINYDSLNKNFTDK